MKCYIQWEKMNCRQEILWASQIKKGKGEKKSTQQSKNKGRKIDLITLSFPIELRRKENMHAEFPSPQPYPDFAYKQKELRQHRCHSIRMLTFALRRCKS